MQQQQIHCTKITTVQNEHLFMTIQSFLVCWPLNDQITVSFVRAAGVLAKGRMFDMPGMWHITLCLNYAHHQELETIQVITACGT